MRSHHVANKDWKQIAAIIASGESFQGSNLWGEPGNYFSPGKMSWEEYESAVKGRPFTYVIYSYKTPIAWRDSDGRWTITSSRYSQSTDRHISSINLAVYLGDV